MLRKPDPGEVLQLISCHSKKSKCNTGFYIYLSHGLPCTDLCGCPEKECGNKNKEDLDGDDEEENDDDEDIDN